MTKKDFIALADAIREHNQLRAYNHTRPFDEGQIATLADFCQSQNHNFLRGRWLAYIAGECGKNGGKIRTAA